MLPGPTNVPNRVMRAMLAPIINHRSDDFVELYTDVVDKTQQVFETQNDIVALSASGTGAVEAGVVNLVKKGDKVTKKIFIKSVNEFKILTATCKDKRVNIKYGDKSRKLHILSFTFDANSNQNFQDDIVIQTSLAPAKIKLMGKVNTPPQKNAVVDQNQK